MRFMMLVKHPENQGNPPKALMDAITKIAEEAAKKGNMLGSGGLAPTAQSVRVRVSGGQVTRDRRAVHRGQRSGRRICAV